MTDSASATADNPDRAWFEDGILFQEYNSDITLERIRTICSQTIALLDERHFHVAPLVCILHDNTLRLNLADMAKVAQIPLSSRVSWVLSVGLNSKYRPIVETANKLFFNGRVLFFERMVDAKHTALQHLDDQTNILEA